MKKIILVTCILSISLFAQSSSFSSDIAKPVTINSYMSGPGGVTIQEDYDYLSLSINFRSFAQTASERLSELKKVMAIFDSLNTDNYKVVYTTPSIKNYDNKVTSLFKSSKTRPKTETDAEHLTVNLVLKKKIDKEVSPIIQIQLFKLEIDKLQIPESIRLYKGTVTPVLDNPEQYRQKYINAVKKDIDMLKKELGYTTIMISGLNSPLVIKNQSLTSCILYIPYRINLENK